MRERRLRWPIAAESRSRRSRPHRSQHRAARQVHFDRLRHRHPDPASRHVGKPAPGRARCRRRKLHDHWDIRLDSGRVLRFHDPRRFGSLHWTEIDPDAASAAGEIGAGTVERGVRRRVPVPRDPQAQRRHQAVHHEFAARGRRRATFTPAKRCFARGFRRAARPAGSPAREAAALAQAIKDVLGEAIKIGGTTLARLRQCRRRARIFPPEIIRL